MRTLKLSATIICLAFILISCGGGGGGGGSDTTSPEIIGPSGGVLEVNDPTSSIYGTRIEVPSGALNEPILLTMDEIVSGKEPPEGAVSAGPTINFGPDGTAFATEVTITMPYYDLNDDGLIDGTDIPEEYVCSLTYDEGKSRWLYLKKIRQDTENNTITFSARHFSNDYVVAQNPSNSGRDDVAFFTIDGLDFDKTADWKTLFFGSLGYDGEFRPAYLKTALLDGMNLGLKPSDVYSYDETTETKISWSGDANYTECILPDIVSAMTSEYSRAKSSEKKFVLMTHSWGTVLAFLALEYSKVEPDLFITLSSPL